VEFFTVASSSLFEFVDISTKRLYTKHMDARETRGGPRWEAKGTGIVSSA